MRIKIELKALNSKEITYNYHYQLSTAIYNMLKLGTYEFSDYMHKQNFSFADKRFKLFTFALQFRKFDIKTDFIQLIDPNADLYISAPLIDTFIIDHVIPALENRLIKIQNGAKDIRFSIEKVDIMQDPEFSNLEKFVLLAPLVLTARVDIEGVKGIYYLRYFDDPDEINRLLNEDLKIKYEMIFGRETDSSVLLEWDPDYVAINESKHKRLTSNIILDDGKRKLSVVGNKLPFTLKGDPNLMRIGYDCGFGERNSQGFGMVKVVRSTLL